MTGRSTSIKTDEPRAYETLLMVQNLVLSSGEKMYCTDELKELIARGIRNEEKMRGVIPRPVVK